MSIWGFAVLALALLLPAVPAWAAPSVSFELTSGNTGTGNTIASANGTSKIRIIFDTDSNGTDKYAHPPRIGQVKSFALEVSKLKDILTLKKIDAGGDDLAFTVAHEVNVKESGRWKDKFIITPSANLVGGTDVYVAITNRWGSYPNGFNYEQGSAANATYQVKTVPPKPTLTA